jgi:hypothetical protein
MNTKLLNALTLVAVVAMAFGPIIARPWLG